MTEHGQGVELKGRGTGKDERGGPWMWRKFCSAGAVHGGRGCGSASVKAVELTFFSGKRAWRLRPAPVALRPAHQTPRTSWRRGPRGEPVSHRCSFLTSRSMASAPIRNSSWRIPVTLPSSWTDSEMSPVPIGAQLILFLTKVNDMSKIA